MDIKDDFLKELANVGIGHAATSLSKMVDAQVNISLPMLDVTKFDAIIASNDQRSNAVLMGIQGELTGDLIIISSDQTSFWLIDRICGSPIGTTSGYDDMGKSAMMEFGNIIGGAFLTSLSDLTQYNLMPRVPQFYLGDGKELRPSIVEHVHAQTNGQVDDVLSVKTELSIDGMTLQVQTYLILDKESFAKLIAKYGM